MTSADTRARRAARKSANTARGHLRLVDPSASSVYVMVLDAQGRLTHANETALDAVGVTLEQVQGTPYADTPWWRHCALSQHRVRAGLEAGYSGETCQLEVMVNHDRLGLRQMELTVQPIGVGEAAILVCSAVDVTDRQHLLESLRMTRTAVDSLSGPVMHISSEGIVAYVNDAACLYLGYRREELLGMAVSALDPDITDETWDELWHGFKTERTRIWPARHRHKDGRVLPARQRATWFVHQDDEFVFVYVEDFARPPMLALGSEPRREDLVTGLPDRAWLLTRINECMNRAAPAGDALALLAVGIDRFQLVNDILGPEQADELLRAVSRRIQSLAGNRVVARLESDEFAVLVEGGQQECAALMREVGETFNCPLELGGREFYITCSMGMAGLYEGDTAEALVRHAWNALYQAKASGRNNYTVWHSQTGNCDSDELAMELALYRAIQNDELVLYYQPCIDADGGRTVSFEALVRWNHPEKGLLPPGRFVPLAEQSDLIIALGEWILRDACLQYRAWKDAGNQPQRVRVNLSPRQFRQRNLLEHMLQILDETGVPASALEMEITEGMLMDDIEHSMAVMHRMRELGMRISLDDFGMGYSCLSQLRNCPLDSIKIDKSFVQDIVHDDTALAIVETITRMGHRLGLKVVAEGVETREQFELLRTVNCDQIQGFLFAQPLPAEIATRLLVKKRRLIPV